MTYYFFAAYYGPGGRKDGKNRDGEREGDCAIEVWHATADGRDMEANLARSRTDIGRVDKWEQATKVRPYGTQG